MSSDPDGAIVQFDWDFGDGGGFMNDLGPTPSHLYGTPDLFTVTLRVTDDDGAVSMCTTTADVNAPPICDAGPGQSGNVGDTLTFDGSLSSDLDGTIVQYDWLFGDGSGIMFDVGPTPSHVYASEDLYIVQLRVTDDDGSVSICTTTADRERNSRCVTRDRAKAATLGTR